MLIRAELKQKSKEQLKGNWAITGGLFLLLSLIMVGATFIPVIGPLVQIIICGPIVISGILIIFKVVKGQRPRIEDVGSGFYNFPKALGLLLWMTLWEVLWTLLFIIPGIIKSISYCMAMYILADNPDIGIREALKESMRITEGHKWELFVLSLSFIGWSLLASLTCGIGYFWLIPYMQTTFVNTYFQLKEEA